MTTADHSNYGHTPTQASQSRIPVTGAVLLAAGFSRRFGSVKLQARLPDGNTILQQCFNNILQATDNIIVVGRKDLLANGVYQFLPAQPRIQLILCEDAESGMGHSLACAVKQLPEDWQSVLVCLGDMPLVRPDTLKNIIAASAGDTIVIPVWQSQRGHPVSFGRKYFAELADSQGDTGGRHIIRKYSRNIHELQTDDQGVVQDIDTPEALALLTG
jgi:molybdenum cofactor cytidylyltransferase